MSNFGFNIDIKTAEATDVQLERQIRRLIESGELAPGQRLPPFAEMARTFRVSTVSLNRAMARLAAAGLIERRQRRGSFVRQGVRVMNVAVVTGTNLSDEPAYFARALMNELRQAAIRYNWDCRVYDHLHLPPGSSADPSWSRLLSDLSNYPFTGVIDLNGVFDREEVPRNLPIVRWGTDTAHPDVVINQRQFTSDAATHLYQQGCRRFAYVRAFDHSADSPRFNDLLGFDDARKEHPFEAPEIIQLKAAGGADQFERKAYEQTLAVVRQWARTGHWPEALIVSDDVATRAVALALIKEQIDVPEKIRMLSLANRNILLHYGVPVERYELDLGHIATTLLDLLVKRTTSSPLPELPIGISGQLATASGGRKTNARK